MSDLLSLPDELILHSLAFLPSHIDRLHVAHACQRLRNLAFDVVLWRGAQVNLGLVKILSQRLPAKTINLGLELSLRFLETREFDGWMANEHQAAVILRVVGTLNVEGPFETDILHVEHAPHIRSVLRRFGSADSRLTVLRLTKVSLDLDLCHAITNIPHLRRLDLSCSITYAIRDRLDDIARMVSRLEELRLGSISGERFKLTLPVTAAGTESPLRVYTSTSIIKLQRGDYFQKHCSPNLEHLELEDFEGDTFGTDSAAVPVRLARLRIGVHDAPLRLWYPNLTWLNVEEWNIQRGRKSITPEQVPNLQHFVLLLHSGEGAFPTWALEMFTALPNLRSVSLRNVTCEVQEAPEDVRQLLLMAPGEGVVTFGVHVLDVCVCMPEWGAARPAYTGFDMIFTKRG